MDQLLGYIAHPYLTRVLPWKRHLVKASLLDELVQGLDTESCLCHHTLLLNLAAVFGLGGLCEGKTKEKGEPKGRDSLIAMRN